MPAPKATATGWAIHDEEVVDFDGRCIRVNEVVPYAETSRSPDGYFYHCQDVGQIMTKMEFLMILCGAAIARCFFALVVRRVG